MVNNATHVKIRFKTKNVDIKLFKGKKTHIINIWLGVYLVILISKCFSLSPTDLPVWFNSFLSIHTDQNCGVVKSSCAFSWVVLCHEVQSCVTSCWKSEHQPWPNHHPGPLALFHRVMGISVLRLRPRPLFFLCDSLTHSATCSLFLFPMFYFLFLFILISSIWSVLLVL